MIVLLPVSPLLTEDICVAIQWICVRINDVTSGLAKYHINCRVLSSASGKDPVPIVQEAGWAPGPVWTDGKSRPHRDSIPDRPARSQSLYRLSYPGP